MDKSKNLLKCASMFLIYFLYTYFAGVIASLIANVDKTLIMLILDLLFLIFIVFMYRKNLKKDIELIKKDYKVSKVLKVIVLGALSLIVLNLIIGGIVSVLNITMDENTQAIKDLATVSMIYTLFKTMIFGVVAEELLFRESLSECIDNNILFVVSSAAIYTVMNFIFTSSNTNGLVIGLLVYFVPSLLLSTIYIKNKKNIVLVILIKLVYNLIPLMLLLTGK